MDEEAVNILSGPLSIFIILLIAILVLCSIFGNAIILIAIHYDPNMQSVGYLFVGSKAIADLLTMIMVIPMAAVDDLLGYWPFDDDFCEVWMAFDVTLVTVPVLTLLSLAIDRYVHMKYPTFYLRYFSKRIVILINICAWLISTLVFAIPWSISVHRKQYTTENQNRTMCIPQYPPALSITFAVLAFVAPSICMIFLYKRLYKYSKETTRKFKLMFKTLQTNYPDLDPKIPFLSEQRATKTIGVIMLTFVICWTPFFVMSMLSALNPQIFTERLPMQIVQWIGYSNCIISPLLYVSSNRTFRAAFAKTLGIINEEAYNRKVSIEVTKRGSKESENVVSIEMTKRGSEEYENAEQTEELNL